MNLDGQALDDLSGIYNFFFLIECQMNNDQVKCNGVGIQYAFEQFHIQCYVNCFESLRAF